MRRILVVLVFLVGGCAVKGDYAQESQKEKTKLKYNHIENEYQHAEEGESLKYNHIEDKYEYADEDADLRYNYIEDRYEYE